MLTLGWDAKVVTIWHAAVIDLERGLLSEGQKGARSRGPAVRLEATLILNHRMILYVRLSGVLLRGASSPPWESADMSRSTKRQQWQPPARMTAEEYMPVMIARIVENFDPVQILLFGSRARGTATEASDVDIIVVFPAVEDAIEMICAIRCDLLDSPFCMDIFVTTPEDLERRRHTPCDVLSFAMPEARVLYDRPHARRT